jgi:hypothetical protein
MSKIDDMVLELFDGDQQILTAVGFDEAFVGIGVQFNTPVAVYDYVKCIDILAEEMDYEDAIEFFEYNVIGAYVGEQTPIFLRYPENS